MSYDLRALPAPIDAALLDRCAGLETATLGHWRSWGLCDPRIRQVIGTGSIRATAVTLALPGPDGALLHDVLGEVRPGDVIVIDRLGDVAYACVGGIVARAARLRGAAGIVVDGPVADLAELRAIGLPIWAHGAIARTTRRLGMGGRYNAPVSIGGAVVHSGDLVIADADGVAVIEPGEIAATLALAARRHDRERAIADELAAGRALKDLLPAPLLGTVG